MIKPLIRISLSLIVFLQASTVGVSAGTGSARLRSQGGGRLTSASTIYFVPVGEISAVSLDELVRHYKQKFQINIKILPGLQLDKPSVVRQGKQYAAEDLIEYMKSSYPQLARNPKVILIEVTEEDMYIRKFTWKFAFSYRAENRFAVVSSARINPVNYGQPADRTLLHTRLRKLVTKHIGILYFGLRGSDDPRSVLYRSIMGLEELDRVGEDF
jgi:predicted Zn-dependent protease